MSVNPGFGGQQFIEPVLGKLAEARRRIDASGRDVRLEVDGGVKLDNIGAIARRARTVVAAGDFVTGSAIFGDASGIRGGPIRAIATAAKYCPYSRGDRGFRELGCRA